MTFAPAHRAKLATHAQTRPRVLVNGRAQFAPSPNIVGQRFGLLRVERLHHVEKGTGTRFFVCRCACGWTHITRYTLLSTGQTWRCGRQCGVAPGLGWTEERKAAIVAERARE